MKPIDPQLVADTTNFYEWLWFIPAFLILLIACMGWRQRRVRSQNLLRLHHLLLKDFDYQAGPPGCATYTRKTETHE